MKKTPIIMYLGITAFFLLGLFFCGFYAPATFNLFVQQSSVFDYIELSLYWLCSVPCFVLLIYAIKIAKMVGKNEFFSSKTVRYLKVCGCLLSIDSFVFLVVNFVFAIIRQSLLFEVLMLLLSLVGLAIGVSMILSSKAVEQSKQYKEDGEGIL